MHSSSFSIEIPPARRFVRASDFYDLVSGRRRGVLASLLRAGLAVAEAPYRAGVWWRNRRYDKRSILTHHVEAPVVSIGNLTLGGSGKTPMVKWVCRKLREEGVRVAILSRGYGAQEGKVNDEALELEHALPDVPHLQDPDRVAMAHTAIEELAAQALVLDDGFQHRRLGRDLDIVLLDATEPFGFGRVFPRGALREPVASLNRADVVCLTRADLVEESARREIHARIARIAPHALWCESITTPRSLIGLDSSGKVAIEEPVESIQGRRILAFCGLGNPAAFRATLNGLGAEIVEFIEFPDHYAYWREDIERLESSVRSCDAELALCTHKDLVKVMLSELGETPLRALTIESKLVRGEEGLNKQLRRIASLAQQEDT